MKQSVLVAMIWYGAY